MVIGRISAALCFCASLTQFASGFQIQGMFESAFIRLELDKHGVSPEIDGKRNVKCKPLDAAFEHHPDGAIIKVARGASPTCTNFYLIWMRYLGRYHHRETTNFSHIQNLRYESDSPTNVAETPLLTGFGSFNNLPGGEIEICVEPLTFAFSKLDFLLNETRNSFNADPSIFCFKHVIQYSTKFYIPINEPKLEGDSIIWMTTCPYYITNRQACEKISKVHTPWTSILSDGYPWHAANDAHGKKSPSYDCRILGTPSAPLEALAAPMESLDTFNHLELDSGLHSLETVKMVASFTKPTNQASLFSQFFSSEGPPSGDGKCPSKEAYRSALHDGIGTQNNGAVFVDFGHSLRLAHLRTYPGCWAIVARATGVVKEFFKFQPDVYTSGGATYIIEIARLPSWAHAAMHCQRSCGICDNGDLECYDFLEAEGGMWCEENERRGNTQCPLVKSKTARAKNLGQLQRSAVLFGKGSSETVLSAPICDPYRKKQYAFYDKQRKSWRCCVGKIPEKWNEKRIRFEDCSSTKGSVPCKAHDDRRSRARFSVKITDVNTFSNRLAPETRGAVVADPCRGVQPCNDARFEVLATPRGARVARVAHGASNWFHTVSKSARESRLMVSAKDAFSDMEQVAFRYLHFVFFNTHPAGASDPFDRRLVVSSLMHHASALIFAKNNETGAMQQQMASTYRGIE